MNQVINSWWKITINSISFSVDISEELKGKLQMHLGAEDRQHFFTQDGFMKASKLHVLRKD